MSELLGPLGSSFDNGTACCDVPVRCARLKQRLHFATCVRPASRIDETQPHPMFSEVLNKYLFAWGEAEKFLACTVGKGCEYWRERFYSSMRKQS